jgi:DNA-binding NarL/FixJ family response regulator
VSAEIRIVIVDDHAMLADALQMILSAQEDLDVVGVAGTLREGLVLAAATRPDVVLMDNQLPDGEGTRAATAVREASGAAVLVLTADPAPSVIRAALENGCAGVVRKGDSLQSVVAAIRNVQSGEGVFSRNMLHAVAQRPHGDVQRLTARELEVLQLLDGGQSTAQIAAHLVLSAHTVRNHVRNLTAKLGACTRLEALARARATGLLEGVTAH